MNKPRLPFDIQFLLESVLDESPDGVKLQGPNDGGTEKSDPGRLNSLGAEVPKQGGNIHWVLDDAYAFFADRKNSVIMYTHKETHGDIENVLSSAAGKAKMYPATFKNMYEVGRDGFNNVYIWSYKDKTLFPDSTPTRVAFIGLDLGGDDTASVVNYLSKNLLYFRTLSIRGGEEEDTDGAPEFAGRIWAKKNVISFWNKQEDVLGEFNLVEKLMDGMRLDKKRFAYEFIDSNGLFAYSEIHDKGGERLSPEEIKKLMAAQHLDSKAKKKLASAGFKDKQLKKAAKGFDFAAQANAVAPALENEEKLPRLQEIIQSIRVRK